MTVSTKDRRNPCRDCGMPTTPHGASGEWLLGACEYYVVWPEVWRQAVPESTNDYSDGGFLCIGCLESRLGRRLTPVDFADNFWRADHPNQSPRLRNRLGLVA